MLFWNPLSIRPAKSSRGQEVYRGEARPADAVWWFLRFETSLPSVEDVSSLEEKASTLERSFAFCGNRQTTYLERNHMQHTEKYGEYQIYEFGI